MLRSITTEGYMPGEQTRSSAPGRHVLHHCVRSWCRQLSLATFEMGGALWKCAFHAKQAPSQSPPLSDFRSAMGESILVEVQLLRFSGGARWRCVLGESDRGSATEALNLNVRWGAAPQPSAAADAATAAASSPSFIHVCFPCCRPCTSRPQASLR